MRSKARFVVFGVLTAATAVACADIFGFQDLQGPDGGADASSDVVVTDANDAGDCTARAVDDATGVFVTVNGADTSTCGTRAEPCMTIQTGINQAKLNAHSTVYIARGTYVESISLADGITLEGGWDTASLTWIPVCDTTKVSAVKITMPSATNVVVAIGGGTAGLRYVSVIGKASAQASESVYGIFATNATLTLDTISVSVNAGGDGASGIVGDAGAQGAIDCDAGDAAAGAASGNVGVGASEGAFGATGYTPQSGGPGAADGSTGTPGTCTINSSCITTCYTCLSICVNALAGCGGEPGFGGSGGLGGGSSVAVYGWNANIKVIGGAIASGNGGAGGAGGGGGAGGSGGAGGVKDAVCNSFCNDAGCATVGDTSPQIGGTGGTGASGGQGGGGAGGSSFALFNGGDAGTVTLTNAPALTFGQPGAGGVVNGASGNASGQGP